jgi:CRISPR-associated protein Cas1
MNLAFLLPFRRRAVAAPAPRAPRVRQPGPGDAFGTAALERAFLRVRANGGGPGGDGVTAAVFDRTRAGRLGALGAALMTGVYRPGPLRRLSIAKPAGGRRALAVPCVADRVAQTAWLFALSPSIEARLHPASFAYRAGRGVREALAAARAHVAGGRPFVVRVDIASFFDTVPHARLLAELPGWVQDAAMLSLARGWVRHAAPNGRGLPQGSPISPLLANLYLDPLDRALAARGRVHVRYADDIALFCRSRPEAEAALSEVADLLSERGLSLNREKSRAAHARTGVTFLGAALVPARQRLLHRLRRLLRRLWPGAREKG